MRQIAYAVSKELRQNVDAQNEHPEVQVLGGPVRLTSVRIEVIQKYHFYN